MEDIYADKKIDNNEIKSSLLDLFPDLSIFYWDFNGDSPLGLDIENSDHIFFNTTFHNDKREFGLVISIYRTPKEDYQERGLLIGKKISIDSNVRVLVPFTNPEDTDNPYYDIVFDNGLTYLANDSDTNFADGSEGLVIIIKEHKLPELRFDKRARKISKSK